jgi:hypothetical protein
VVDCFAAGYWKKEKPAASVVGRPFGQHLKAKRFKHRPGFWLLRRRVLEERETSGFGHWQTFRKAPGRRVVQRSNRELATQRKGTRRERNQRLRSLADLAEGTRRQGGSETGPELGRCTERCQTFAKQAVSAASPANRRGRDVPQSGLHWVQRSCRYHVAMESRTVKRTLSSDSRTGPARESLCCDYRAMIEPAQRRAFSEDVRITHQTQSESVSPEPYGRHDRETVAMPFNPLYCGMTGRETRHSAERRR